MDTGDGEVIDIPAGNGAGARAGRGGAIGTGALCSNRDFWEILGWTLGGEWVVVLFFCNFSV